MLLVILQTVILVERIPLQQVKAMKTFLLDQDGQGMTEYGLILAVIAVVIVVAIPGRVVEAILGIYESFLGVFEARKTL